MIDSLRVYVKGSPLNGVLFLLLLVFTGMAVFSFFGFVISELFLGIPLLTDPTLVDKLASPELLPAARLMQLALGLGTLLLPALVYLWLSSSVAEFRQMFLSPIRQSVLISIAFFLVAFPFINYIADWNANLVLPTFVGDWMHDKEEQAGEMTKLLLNMPHVGVLLFNLFMIALVPAVGEELIFRGIVQRGIIKQWANVHAGIWFAAILFSAFHFQFLGFVPRLLMGVAMGYLYYWSNNLWYPIIAHFTNNAVAVILAYGMQHGSVDGSLENIGIGNLSIATFSLIFCMMLLYLFRQHQQTVFAVSKGELD